MPTLIQHAFDERATAFAIDTATRKLAQQGRRPVRAAFALALG